MPITSSTGQLATLSKRYNALFLRGLERAGAVWQDLATRVPSITTSEVYPWLGGMPGLNEWVGRRQANEMKSYDFVIKNRHYEGTLRVNRDAIDDNQLGMYDTMAEGLGNAAALHPDDLLITLIEAGFTTNGADGTTFFSTSHASSGTNQSNKGTTALSASSFATAVAQMRNLTDDQGKKLGVNPNLLVVPPSLEQTALEICNAPIIINSGGTAAGTNVWQGRCKPYVLSKLTDSNDWYLLDRTKPFPALIMQVRKDPVLIAKTADEDENVFENNEYVWGVDWRGAAGYGFWQLMFGAHV